MRGPSGGVLMDRVVSDAAGSTMALDPRKQSDDSSSDPHLRSVGSSSSLSSTVYEDDADALPTANNTNNNNQAVPVATSTDKTLGFESSAFFRFADFGATSTTTASAATTDDFFAPTTLDKKDVPSNQTTHDDPEDGEADDVVPPTTPVLPIHHHHHRINVASRRKNSIEMFLSQSPSQALGGGFLKMALDDDDPPPPPPELELGASSTTKASAGGVAATVSARVGGNGGGSAATSAAATAPYGYLLSRNSPAVDTDDEWSSTSSQEMLSSNTSASAYYYAESQAALHHQQSQQAFGYGASDGFRYGNEGYSAGARTTHHQTTWNSSPYNTGMAVPSASQPSYASMSPAASAYGHGRYQQAPPMHPYPQQPSQHAFHHQQQGTGHRGHNGGRPAYSRSQSMYATSNPASRMMMDSSPPPPSPAPGMYGVKQCKFFLQGHCRMGNKCKFAHHSPQHPSVAQQSPYMHQQHSQSFRLAQPSPASSPSHHSQHDFDTMAATQSSFMPRGGSSRPLYRTNSTDIQQSLVSPHHHAHQHNAQGAVGALVHGDEVLAVEDVHGRVFAMSKDQNGCRLLQEQLEFYEERKQLCDVIYLEAMDHLAEMMVDPFGNYLFQKLLERAKPLQRLEMVRRVSGHLVAAALNLHGTRSVQKVVEVCATSAQVVELDSDGRESRRVNLPDLIVEALKDDAVRLCIDSNGNHVIQRALQFMKPEYNQFVFDAVAKECTTVGTHRHGCCVLQRCLDAANDQQKREVITQVEKQAMKLMQDPYGNYVVQYVLDSCSAEEAFGVISKPLGSVFELSIQKFSSNVIEKCLEKAPPSVLAQYVDEITHCPKMQKMLQDQFANYVVQRALCVATEDQCMTLVKAIRPHLAAMKNTSGGRRITARILKRFPHMDLSLDLGFGPTTHGDAYGMATNAYGMHPDHHHQYQTQYQYGSSYGVMPSIRSDGSDSGMPSFASSSGTLGLRLHDNGSVGHRM